MRLLRWRCAGCGERLGVYEPVLVVADGRARISSLAAEPELRPELGDIYHESCHGGGFGAWRGGGIDRR